MIMMGDKKKMLTAILGPHKEVEEMPSVDEMETIMQEFIECVHGKDAQGAAAAFKAACALCDSEPHVEGEHLE
jgi:hypothetical protein